MEKTKLYKYKYGFYPFNLYIVFGNDPSFILKHFKCYYKNEDELNEDFNKSSALTMNATLKEGLLYGVLIFFNLGCEINNGLFVHESSHATKRLFKHISADINDSETFEYALGFTFNCCVESYNKYKKISQIKKEYE